MSSTFDEIRLRRLEAILTALLRYGAMFASAWIAIGLLLGDSAVGGRCLAGGIVMLIALPVLRVAIMTVMFAFERDYRFALISAAVLSIIAVGFALGVVNANVDFQ
jgi:uncharacterized membrane protein